MLSFRFGTVIDFHWGFKPVLSYSKHHTFSTFLGEEKERNKHLLSPTRSSREHSVHWKNSSLGFIEVVY